MVLNFIKSTFNNKNRNYVLCTQVINTIIGLITGKLIAVFVLPEDFGNYNIQFATYTLFSMLLASPFIQFVKSSNNTFLPKIGSRLYIITGLGIITITYFLILVALYLYYGFIDNILFVFFLFFIPISLATSVIGDYLNIKNNIIAYSRISLLKSIGGLIFIGLFFAFGSRLLDSVVALWLMKFAGGFAAFIVFHSNYKIYKSRIKVAYTTFLKKYLQFAKPLMFSAIWAWVNNYFDRYAIDYYLTLEEVGIYNANYSVGSKFFLLLSPIFIILLTPFVYASVSKKVKKHSVRKYGLYYVALATPILITIYLMRDSVGNLLLSQNYKDGFYLIFWIGLAFFFLTLTQLYESFFYAEYKTKIILLGNVISALLNVILNILLIPKYGIMGAAIATCLGFIVHFIVIYYNFKKI